MSETVPKETQIEIAALLLKSQAWDNFLATKFSTVKRYGAEGAESMMAFFRELFMLSVDEDLFKSHFELLFQAVNPVSMGKARSKQQMCLEGGYGSNADETFSKTILNVQLHGDAAFAGQGINQEMLMMAGTPHFDVGGTIHMIVNNQIGFTTPAERGKTSRYNSDLAKSILAPVFHVNGDDPESLCRITKLAFEYQRKFRKDIFIDLNCFRRWGHNEVDDPTITNPSMYQIIHSRKSVPDLYSEKIVNENVTTREHLVDVVKEHVAFLNSELSATDSYKPEAYYFKKQWSHIQQASSNVTTWDTGVDYNLLRYIGEKSVTIPQDFNLHPHLLKTHVNARIKKLNEGQKIDFATAEAMAMGSLMYQGYNVRISGEDVGRGTFAHRHAMLVDQKTNEMFIPLNAMEGGFGGKLEIANSILSEEAVLGFEYGMSIDNPNACFIWEAQFGDFFNGAQIIFDAFIASGETKWMYSSGLVILLPHGYDGAASEHSSCRIERFLQQTDSKETLPDGDDVNMQVINPTTPAQMFHALRRQIIRNFRKPLIVVSPKILLRLSNATSSFADFEPGKSFLPVIGDNVVSNPANVKRIILCSGKHYYALNDERLAKKYDDVAIIRVESLCPFPVGEINKELEKYKNANIVVWSQEEHRNMGAWTFVKPRFENMCGRKIKYYGRSEGGTPAVGVSLWHKAEAADVVRSPFTIV
ncbi:hypothetical protein HA402_001148 [Bradysia odoriphaga]|nr:hypothetical protein HA402_001148 [Bradysia odoriphaga]